MRRVLIVITTCTTVAFALIACRRDGRGGGPGPVRTAMDACRRFEAAGAASGCREEAVQPALTPGAKQRVTFFMPSGRRGQVFSFDDKNDYAKSAKSIEDLYSEGRHRFGNKSAMLYAQLNRESTVEEARKIRDLLESF